MIALSLVVCLSLANREAEAEIVVNNNDILRAPYEKLISIKNYGEFRTALYCLKKASFSSDGKINNGNPKRVATL